MDVLKKTQRNTEPNLVPAEKLDNSFVPMERSEVIVNQILQTNCPSGTWK